MDSVLLFLILEYIDEYQINKFLNIKPYNTNLKDIIDINIDNNYIRKQHIKEQWKTIYSTKIIHELNMLFLYSNQIIIYTKINVYKKYKYIKIKKLICLNIKQLFYERYSKILQSRIPLKYYIKNHHKIIMPSILKLEFKILKKYHSFKFIE